MRRKKAKKTLDPALLKARGPIGQVLSILLGLAALSAGSRADCDFDRSAGRLECRLRTLNAHNASFSSSSRAEAIGIECSDVFFYESFLRTNHFGYLPNLRRLDLEFCKVRRVPSLAFSGLSGLRELTLRTRNSEWSAMVMELEKDALTGLNDLRLLNLTQNNLWTLPAAAFCSLDSLRVLNLSTNYLQDILDLGFSSREIRSCRLPLQILDLSSNSFTVVASNAFGQLSRLHTLNLAGNNLNVLEDDALGGLPELAKLDLSNNELVALPPGLLKSSGSLRELYLQNNSLSALAPGIFGELESLLLLNLSRNDLSNDWLNADTFTPLTQLRALDLSHNQLSKLDPNLFEGMVNLKIIQLQNNRIFSIAANTFSHHEHLQILSLSHNQLETLHPKSIVHLPLLNLLSLDHNQLRSLHRNFLKNCTTLQDLALNNNFLREVPKCLRSLPLIRTLDLAGNGITHVKNESFAGLGNLYGLRLADNGLRHIQSRAFAPLSQLHVLNLAHNALDKSTLPQDVLNPLTELRVLRLDSNGLEDLDGLLTAQAELVWLNVSSNGLQWFDYASIPRKVRWLDLHDNKIEEIGNYYKNKNNYSIETMDLSHNLITRITPLSLVSSLESVYLHHNRINEVMPHSFAQNPRLKRVELEDNLLKQLTLSALTVSLDYSLAKDPATFDGKSKFLLLF